MILTALKVLAEREELVMNPHFEEKAVGYVLIVNEAGRLLGVQPLSEPALGGREPSGNISLSPGPYLAHADQVPGSTQVSWLTTLPSCWASTLRVTRRRRVTVRKN